MKRQWITRLACGAVVAAVVLAFVPSAHAQRGWRNAARAYTGFQPGYFGVSPGYFYPGSGLGVSIGFGNYAGMYGGYYGNPGYGNFQQGTYYYPNQTYTMPGYTYSGTPGYYPNQGTIQGTVVTPGDQTGGMIRQMPSVETQSAYRPPAGTALIVVKVPEDAFLWFDEAQATTPGSERRFITPTPLEPGKNYHYKLTAEWMNDGQKVRRERTVNFQAGQEVVVDFNQETEQ